MRAPAERVERLRSGLFAEMRRTMNLPEPEADDDPTRLFIPEPLQGRDNFLDEYLRTLPEYRYVRPGGTTMSGEPGVPVAKMAERMNTERDFEAQCTTS